MDAAEYAPARSIASRQVLAFALMLHAVIAVAVFAGAAQPASDFDRYYEIAATPGRPYVDFQVEHPIATLLVFRSLAYSGNRPAFGRAVVAVNIAADAIVIAALAWGWGSASAAAYAVCIAPILGLLLNRIDLWSMAAATLAVAAWMRGLRAAAGAALAAAAGLKLWPLVLAPILFVVPRPAGDRLLPSGAVAIARRPDLMATAGGFVLTMALLGAAMWNISGFASVWQVGTFRGATGWQIESFVGALLHLVTRLPIRIESGSWRIGQTTGVVTLGMFAAAVVVCLWTMARAARAGRIGAGWLASVSALLVLSPLLSAQFAGWLAPGAAIAWSDGERRLAWLAAAAVVLTELLWEAYGSVINGALPALMLVVARNAVLVLIVGSGMARAVADD